MATTKKRPGKTKKTTKPIGFEARLRRLSNHPAARPLLLLVVILAIVGVVTLQGGPVSLSDPRSVADGFMYALVQCDAPTMKKYYPALAADPEKAASFTKDCQSGQKMSFTFNRELPDSTKNSDNPSAVNRAYLYNFDDPADDYHGGLMVYLVWLPDSKQWQVFGATPTTLP